MSSTSHSDPKFHRKQRVILRIERFSRERYRLVFLVAVVVLVGASFLGSRLKLQSDVLELIPLGNPKVDTFREAVRDFGTIDYLMILLEAGENEGPDELEDYADVLAEKLIADDKVEVVEYRFQPDELFLELFFRNALLFLPYDQLDDAQIATAARSLTSPPPTNFIRKSRAPMKNTTAPTNTSAGQLFGSSRIISSAVIRVL